VETPANCASDGSQSCVATGSYFAATLCASNGDTDCVVDDGTNYKASTSSLLIAGNIKNGVVLGGVTGNYPSGTSPLASNTGATDLTSLGSGTGAGAYEFFDSAGAVHSTTVAAGGSVSANTSDQVFSGASTIYNGFTVTGDASLVATKIKSGETILGVNGSVVETPANCASDGSQSCVATGSYFAATLCASNGDTDCVVDDGTNYKASTSSLLIAGNIKNGVVLGGVTGNYPSGTSPLASNTGATDLTSLGSGTGAGAYEFFDSAGAVHSTTVAAGGSVSANTSDQVFSGASTIYNGFTVTGDASLVGTKIKSGETILGVNGSVVETPANCASDGSQSCVATGSYFAATLCASNGDTDCVVDDGTNYKASSSSLLIAGNIKNGVVLGGVTGNYPSGTSPLASNTGATDLTGLGSGTGAGAYEFFDSAGAVYSTTVAAGGSVSASTSNQVFSGVSTIYNGFTVTGDASLVGTNIKSGETILGVNGSVVGAPANCSSGGSQSCVATGSYFAATACGANGSNCFLPSFVTSTQPLKAIDYDDINANKALIRSSYTVSGITGTVSDCSSPNGQDCFATGTYFAAPNCASNGAVRCVVDDGTNYVASSASLLIAGNIKNGVNLGGVTGNYPSSTSRLASNTGATDLTSLGSGTGAGAYEFFDSAGAVYSTTVAAGGSVSASTSNQVFSGASTIYNGFTVTGDASLVGTNIKSGETILGVNGSVVETPANCASGGSQACVATGSYFAGTACGANGSNCFLPSFVTSTQPLKAIDYDDINTNKGLIRSSYTVSGITGTVSDCSSPNGQDCFATGTYYAAPNCSSNGAVRCVVDDGTVYVAATVSSTIAENIKRGVQIGGTTGTYPSAATPLLRYINDGASTAVSGSDITDLTNFATQVTSAGSFEFFSEAGVRSTGSGDVDIVAANVVDNVDFENLSLTGTARECSYGAQGTCEADSACRWTGSACEIDAWNIRYGIAINGQTGSIKANCRNSGNSATYDSDTSPPGNIATVAGSSMDWWDTVDNDDNSAVTTPSEQPAGWGPENKCEDEVWEDVTTDGACDSDADDCMIKDRISGLIWTETYPVASSASSVTATNWSAAVQQCADLSFGSQTDWRLPTQNELMAVYGHNIRFVGYKLGGTIRPSGNTLDNNDYFSVDISKGFWSSTSRSVNTSDGRFVHVGKGAESVEDKAVAAKSVICVRN
jgi:hypothetical protein